MDRNSHIRFGAYFRERSGPYIVNERLAMVILRGDSLSERGRREEGGRPSYTVSASVDTGSLMPPKLARN